MSKLCDLHTHILPGIDDGASTMEYALEMLKNAVASDVEFIVATPHCNTPGERKNYLDPDLQERFTRLQQAAASLPIQLALGAEVHVTEELSTHLMEGRLPSINGSRYLLTEFPMHFQKNDFIKVLQEIKTCGYIPLVAHPERYRTVCEQPQMVEQWLNMGCHVQLTGGSILGESGKTVQRTAAFLLRYDMVACIASDAHGINWRSNFLLDVYDHLSVHYSKQYAQCLMYTNPMRICNDQSL